MRTFETIKYMVNIKKYLFCYRCISQLILTLFIRLIFYSQSQVVLHACFFSSDNNPLPTGLWSSWTDLNIWQQGKVHLIADMWRSTWEATKPSMLLWCRIQGWNIELYIHRLLLNLQRLLIVYRTIIIRSWRQYWMF